MGGGGIGGKCIARASFCFSLAAHNSLERERVISNPFSHPPRGATTPRQALETRSKKESSPSNKEPTASCVRTLSRSCKPPPPSILLFPPSLPLQGDGRKRIREALCSRNTTPLSPKPPFLLLELQPDDAPDSAPAGGAPPAERAVRGKGAKRERAVRLPPRMHCSALSGQARSGGRAREERIWQGKGRETGRGRREADSRITTTATTQERARSPPRFTLRGRARRRCGGRRRWPRSQTV